GRDVLAAQMSASSAGGAGSASSVLALTAAGAGSGSNADAKGADASRAANADAIAAAVKAAAGAAPGAAAAGELRAAARDGARANDNSDTGPAANVAVNHGSAGANASDSSGTAARAATLLPQFLSAIPAAPASAAVGRASTVPMSDPSWPQALAAQVHWMAGSQVQSAMLRLSPEHLGPIQVRIDLQQSQINVSFTAAHAETRAALADAVPRLRELLAVGGLSLGQANVQQESSRGAAAQATVSAGAPDEVESVQSVAVAGMQALGLVDEYV
ncbi:MAG TPA: flagellar hook-length control protein FliK, partial [Steroidobacteraceae bacterium]|nr:flagellar hook-length control protein FliK [Steroidobacteraceae bacterium]